MRAFLNFRVQILLFILAAFVTVSAQSQNLIRKVSRKQTWETSFEVVYLGGELMEFDHGSSVDSDSDIGWGFTFGYNLDEHLNLGFEFNTNHTRYNATIIPEDPTENVHQIKHKMTTYTAQFNGIYHFSPGPVTPYIQAGLGWTNIDSNVADGPPSGYCGWYWGYYYCNTYYRTYDKDSFSYNMALGFRVDLSRTTFVRASYGVLWVDMSKVSSTPTFELGRLEIGMMM